MIMQKEYLDDMKEHIMGMDEKEFKKRGTTKEAVLSSSDIMERLWCMYQNDVEDYGCDKKFSLCDAVNEVIGAVPVEETGGLLWNGVAT